MASAHTYTSVMHEGTHRDMKANAHMDTHAHTCTHMDTHAHTGTCTNTGRQAVR